MLKRTSILLAFAFTGLLAIIGAAALAIWHGAAATQREVTALHESHLQAGNALAAIRANVFLAGIITRDYLLDPDPSHAEGYAAQLNAIRNSTGQNFLALSSARQSGDERKALTQLRAEVDSYWDPGKIVLDWTPQQKAIHRADFLRNRVLHREEILGLAAHVEQLMTANFTAERSRITGANERFQSSLAWTTGFALLLAFAIAAATIARMSRLERQSANAAAELRRLSGQIRMAQEDERRYLSRELHDQAGQMLTGLRMELASISPGDDAEEVARRIEHARGIVDQTLRVIRNIAMLLRPSMLDDLGLIAAIGWLVRDVARTSRIEIHPEIDPHVDSLPDAECTCVYRIVQEALTNAARHSGAQRIDVSLRLNSDGVRGLIADDGRGFPAHDSSDNLFHFSGAGLGLAGMRERVRELGGSLRITSAPGQGTRIEFRLPPPDLTDPSAAVTHELPVAVDAGDL